VALRGGTLIICSDVTLSDFILDSGTVVVKAGAKLTVNNATGLVLKGNCAIYNWGTFQCLGNIVMDFGTASATRPNVIVNATETATFLMPNQYFVINNPYSQFVNNGNASFHGIITDPQAAKGSVCMGPNSSINMSVLYNKAKFSYSVPNGIACVSVKQYSQFYDTLSANPNLNICLASTHTSDASCTAFGCKPNAWGAPQVFTNCTSCLSLFLLPLQIESFQITAGSGYNELSWKSTKASEGSVFYIERSRDGVKFNVIDSLPVSGSGLYRQKDLITATGIYYYRVVYYQRVTDQRMTSIIRSIASTNPASVYPNPARDRVRIQLPQPMKNPEVFLADLYGRQYTDVRFSLEENALYLSLSKLSPGSYLVHIKERSQSFTVKIRKE
jgi:hypothetical protein